MNVSVSRYFYLRKNWRIVSFKKFYRKLSFPSSTDRNPDRLYSLIKKLTEISTDHLTPEIQLRLITSNCYLWHSKVEDCLFSDPYWAFYWPGGQSLARFLLDNSGIIKHQSVLDLGSGCGALAIVSKLLGASHVVANDIDPVAIAAIRMNSALNNVTVNTDNRNLFHEKTLSTNVVLLGDMLYDIGLTVNVARWMKNLPNNTLVLIGDPGRSESHLYLSKMNFKKVVEYELTPTAKMENNGIHSSSVWIWERWRASPFVEKI